MSGDTVVQGNCDERFGAVKLIWGEKEEGYRPGQDQHDSVVAER